MNYDFHKNIYKHFSNLQYVYTFTTTANYSAFLSKHLSQLLVVFLGMFNFKVTEKKSANVQANFV